MADAGYGSAHARQSPATGSRGAGGARRAASVRVTGWSSRSGTTSTRRASGAARPGIGRRGHEVEVDADRARDDHAGAVGALAARDRDARGRAGSDAARRPALERDSTSADAAGSAHEHRAQPPLGHELVQRVRLGARPPVLAHDRRPRAASASIGGQVAVDHRRELAVGLADADLEQRRVVGTPVSSHRRRCAPPRGRAPRRARSRARRRPRGRRRRAAQRARAPGGGVGRSRTAPAPPASSCVPVDPPHRGRRRRTARPGGPARPVVVARRRRCSSCDAVLTGAQASAGPSARAGVVVEPAPTPVARRRAPAPPGNGPRRPLDRRPARATQRAEASSLSERPSARAERVPRIEGR